MFKKCETRGGLLCQEETLRAQEDKEQEWEWEREQAGEDGWAATGQVPGLRATAYVRIAGINGRIRQGNPVTA